MIVNLAEIHLEESGPFEEDIYQDTDLKLLYHLDMDGIEDSPHDPKNR